MKLSQRKRSTRRPKRHVSRKRISKRISKRRVSRRTRKHRRSHRRNSYGSFWKRTKKIFSKKPLSISRPVLNGGHADSEYQRHINEINKRDYNKYLERKQQEELDRIDRDQNSNYLSKLASKAKVKLEHTNLAQNTAFDAKKYIKAQNEHLPYNPHKKAYYDDKIHDLNKMYVSNRSNNKSIAREYMEDTNAYKTYSSAKQSHREACDSCKTCKTVCRKISRKVYVGPLAACKDCWKCDYLAGC